MAFGNDKYHGSLLYLGHGTPTMQLFGEDVAMGAPCDIVGRKQDAGHQPAEES
jgi:hypothetical protein